MLVLYTFKFFFFYTSKDLAFGIRSSIVRSDKWSCCRLAKNFYEGYDWTPLRWVDRINWCYTMWLLQRSTKQAEAPKTAERRIRMVDRISRSTGFEREVGGTRLHISSSQKHMWPVPVLSIMHTWSTMNKFICSCAVQVLLTFSYAASKGEQ